MPAEGQAQRPGRPDEKVLDLEDLGLDRGGHLLVKRALATMVPGQRLGVVGRAGGLAVHLRAWCRNQGHTVDLPYGEVDARGRPVAAWIVRGTTEEDRWRGALRAGSSDAGDPGAVADHPAPTWGLAARGAMVEAGCPAFPFPLDDKAVVWTDDAPRLYRQAAAAQWDPATAVAWDSVVTYHPRWKPPWSRS